MSRDRLGFTRGYIVGLQGGKDNYKRKMAEDILRHMRQMGEMRQGAHLLRFKYGFSRNINKSIIIRCTPEEVITILEDNRDNIGIIKINPEHLFSSPRMLQVFEAIENTQTSLVQLELNIDFSIPGIADCYMNILKRNRKLQHLLFSFYKSLTPEILRSFIRILENTGSVKIIEFCIPENELHDGLYNAMQILQSDLELDLFETSDHHIDKTELKLLLDTLATNYTIKNVDFWTNGNLVRIDSIEDPLYISICNAARNSEVDSIKFRMFDGGTISSTDIERKIEQIISERKSALKSTYVSSVQTEDMKSLTRQMDDMDIDGSSALNNALGKMDLDCLTCGRRVLM